MAEYDTQLLAENGIERTYMLTVNGRTSGKEVEILPPLKNVTSVEVVQARVPLSEYTIESDRNALVLEYADPEDATTVTVPVVLPEQNYSPDSLCQMVNELITSSGITMHHIPTVGKFYMSSDGAFAITEATTCHYPLGLPDHERRESKLDTGSGDYFLMFENRFDLVVSDVVLLNSGDIDTSLTRGNTASNFLPLAEFFLASPGMNDQYSNMDTPYRYFSPIASLDKLNLSFSRGSEQNGTTEQVPYNFRGIRWYVKLAIKTKEFKPKSVAQPGSAAQSTGIHDKSKGLVISGLGSGMTTESSYTYLPMAANVSEYSNF